jgi:hypothetical protein
MNSHRVEDYARDAGWDTAGDGFSTDKPITLPFKLPIST